MPAFFPPPVPASSDSQLHIAENNKIKAENDKIRAENTELKARIAKLEDMRFFLSRFEKIYVLSRDTVPLR
ncbi:16200_t:CDS:2, partial [Cetraspora pellucida]